MSDETQTQDVQAPDVEREGRRLERLRLVVLPSPQPWSDEDDPDPQEAA